MAAFFFWKKHGPLFFLYFRQISMLKYCCQSKAQRSYKSLPCTRPAHVGKSGPWQNLKCSKIVQVGCSCWGLKPCQCKIIPGEFQEKKHREPAVLKFSCQSTDGLSAKCNQQYFPIQKGKTKGQAKNTDLNLFRQSPFWNLLDCTKECKRPRCLNLYFSYNSDRLLKTWTQ